jgi:hypothetical protein
MKLSSAGTPGLSPFLSLIALIISFALVPSVNGSPVIYDQCEKTHYGKAYPAVAPLRAAVNPKDSETGKWDLTILVGVPWTYSSSITIPLL